MNKPTLQEFRASSWANSRGVLRIHAHGDVKNRYWIGSYIHPNAILYVYRQHDYTRIDYALCGRVFSRSWARWWGDRTITRLCKQMVEDGLAGELV